jgi:hypothetical protein
MLSDAGAETGFGCAHRETETRLARDNTFLQVVGDAHLQMC